MTLRAKHSVTIGVLVLAFAITAGTLSNLLGPEDSDDSGDDDSGDDDSGDDDDSAPFSNLPAVPQEAL